MHIKDRIVDMALNGSGIRDTARVLSVAVGAVITTLKKACNLVKIHWKKLVKSGMPEQPVLLLPVALELDEQWSFVSGKWNQRWLWLALNHHNTGVLAYVFSDHRDATCWQLKQSL